MPASHKFTEDTMVQQTTADYLRDALGWESVMAYNEETFGPTGLLGRDSEKEVLLKRRLRAALEKLNPDLPREAYDEAVRIISESSTVQSAIATNRDKDTMLRDGVQVQFRTPQGLRKQRLRVFDFDQPGENDFLCVRELWMKGDLYRRRADIVLFVNGIPLVFMELKNVSKNLRLGFEKNLRDYKDTVPRFFHHNAVIVLANGIDARLGSVSALWDDKFKHFHEWKRLEESEPGMVSMETLLKGTCSKAGLMDLFENFIVFDESSGRPVKIVARNHQLLGVNRAVESVRRRGDLDGKLGVFWHTQGSGKSYSMVFFTRKVLRKLGGHFTFLICTDRDDLDTQIYKTYAGCGVVDHDKDPCRAGDGEELKGLLAQHKVCVFTLIQKFHEDVDPEMPWSRRDDIIVISDEAHRTQYGTLSLNLRNALPAASYIGFTGTPLFKDDEITRRVFGDYVSTYDFQRAVDDSATVPLFYSPRGELLGLATTDLNERIAAKLEELEQQIRDTGSLDAQMRLEADLMRDYHILTAEKRLDQIACDFVEHYSNAWETGKAMMVCLDKITCGRMHALVSRYWQERIQQLEQEVGNAEDEQERIFRERQLSWMKETVIAVVISEEQGEVEAFRKWDLDITAHRRLMKQGFTAADSQRVDLETAFKNDDHPFRVAIVCAMWLTGFDVPSLSTLYLDKPLKAHTLMQAIARANRIKEGKNNGLVVDYCGIFRNLRKALATFAGQGDGGRTGVGERDPAKPEEELLAELAEAIETTRAFLSERGASLEAISTSAGFARNAAVLAAKEAANENDESRRRFEVQCRLVFQRFKAAINTLGINQHRAAYQALNLLYSSLQDDRNRADITAILRELHAVLDAAIDTREPAIREDAPYDISRIDFDRLRREFQQTPAKRTTVQNLKEAIEQRLQRLLQQNPLRTNFQQHYEGMVEEYNREKDRVNIERTFEALLKLVAELNEEEARARREDLDPEALVIFDLLRQHKTELTPAQIKKIKKVAVEMLATLKTQQLQMDHWRDKENTRDGVKLAIHNYLFSDETGLPVDCYTEEEVTQKTEAVFEHVFRVYPTLPSPYFAEAA